MYNNSVAAVRTYKGLKNLDIRDANNYFEKLSEFLLSTRVSFDWPCEDIERRGGRVIGLADGINHLIKNLADLLINNSDVRRRIMFIGNGGSAGIAMHALADYANAGDFETMDFYGPALLTCMSNDYGYENVFTRPIELFAKKDDILFAISSSGKSPNIITAAKTAINLGCYVVTFSGFSADNLLRRIGNLNFYTPSSHYGFVELAHQTLIHCILDLFIRNKIYEEERQAVG